MNHLTIQYPETLPDVLQESAEEFEREARMAMAVKLFELQRISSGIAAQIADVPRVRFLLDLHRYGVAAINLTPDELHLDVENAGGE